jgi:peptidoglycan/xylan/chitin deacetylase (PgdA/CDA1 family)
MQHRRPGRKPYALLTFDDGYLDNYSRAFPVLKEFEVPAVFFIPTGFIGSAKLPWWDEIAWILRHASVERIHLNGCDEGLALGPERVEQAAMRILQRIRSRNGKPMAERVEEIRQACRPKGVIDNQGLFMTWTQVLELHAAGMDIGSHSHSHEILSHLDPLSQKRELACSKEILEAKLGGKVEAVAYPVGEDTSYTPLTCSIAESIGYQFGFNYLRKTNPLPIPNPYDIGRLGVQENVAVAGFKSLVCSV